MISNLNANTEEFSGHKFLPKPQPMNFIYELSLFKINQNPSQPHYLSNFPPVFISQNPADMYQADDLSQDECQNIKTLLKTRSLYVKPEFKLVLSNPFETEIYKGKYFSFKVHLKQLSDIVYPLNESLEIEVLVFNQDDILVCKNMRGQEILRGNSIQNMRLSKPENAHVANFKVQITEVSSHFIGKTLNLKIRARRSDFLMATGWKIKPVCIENLSVKAKKLSSN